MSLLFAWKRLFERPVAQGNRQASDIRSWQKLLLEEQESLREELEAVLRTYVRTVDRFTEHAATLSEEQFAEEQHAIESIRGILQNAIRRLEVSCKDHRELLDEWHEWIAFRRAVGQKQELDPTHRLRIEMIRSELTTRNITVEDPVEAEEDAVVAETGSSAVLVETTTAQPAYVSSQEQQLDDLSDWAELRDQHIEPEWQAAEQAWKELANQAHLSPVQAAAALARLKEAHADLKLLDKAQRRQRHRIAVFESERIA